jgi:hypothetical protein
MLVRFDRIYRFIALSSISRSIRRRLTRKCVVLDDRHGFETYRVASSEFEEFL